MRISGTFHNPELTISNHLKWWFYFSLSLGPLRFILEHGGDNNWRTAPTTWQQKVSRKSLYTVQIQCFTNLRSQVTAEPCAPTCSPDNVIAVPVYQACTRWQVSQLHIKEKGALIQGMGEWLKQDEGVSSSSGMCRSPPSGGPQGYSCIRIWGIPVQAWFSRRICNLATKTLPLRWRIFWQLQHCGIQPWI